MALPSTADDFIRLVFIVEPKYSCLLSATCLKSLNHCEVVPSTMADVRAGGNGWFSGGNGAVSAQMRAQYLRDAIVKVQRQKQRPTSVRICR